MASDSIPAGLLESLRQAGPIVFLTGSGVSAESGVPTFRDAMTGLWSRFRPEDLATPEAFRRDPTFVWNWYRERRMRALEVQPNGAHTAIARMQGLFPDTTLITQNVDGLHQRAGSGAVVEFHGNLFANRCRDCGHESRHDDPGLAEPPPCPECGEAMGPGVVWFGEVIPQAAIEAAWQAATRAEVFFSVGTSGLVYPAAEFAHIARRSGALIVEVNTAETALSPLADYRLEGPAGVLLPSLLKHIS